MMGPEQIRRISDADIVRQSMLRAEHAGILAEAGRDIVPVRDEAIILCLAHDIRPSEVARIARLPRSQMVRFTDRANALRDHLMSGEF